MASLTENILQRFKRAEERKTNWVTTLQEAYEYVAPQRDNFFFSEKGSQKTNNDIVFDSTATSALQKFISNLQSSLVPPMKKWVNLVPGKQLDEDQQEDAAEQLSKIVDVMFSSIKNSNFDTQIAEAFLDLAFGTGALLIQKGTPQSPLKFVTVPIDQLFLEEGPNGKIETSFRKHKVAYRNLLATWPDAKLSSELTKRANEKPDEEICLIEATIPAKIQKQVIVEEQPQVIEVDGFQYVVILEKEKQIIVDREQESSPWIIFRWSVVPGEIYGRGPVLTAFADIKTINKTKELLLKNASIAVSGAYTVVDDGVINYENIQISPGALIPVMHNQGSISGPTIAPLQSASDFNVAQLVLTDLQKSINDIMFADPLGPIDLPVKTATEISIRQQELAKRIGSAFGRLQFELLTPMVNRILFVLEEMGVIDLEGFRVDGRIIDIEHISPLAMAQDQEELMAMMRYVETITGLFGPEAAQTMVKSDVFARKIAKLLNVPMEMVPTKAESNEIREQFLKLSQQNAEAEA